MTEIDTFVAADRALVNVVEQIPEAWWDKQLPDDFPTSDGGTYTMREILDYHAYDEAWIPDMMAGRSIDEVGADTYGDPHGSELLGDDPIGRFRAIAEKAASAVESLDAKDLDARTVHYTYGDYPAREAVWHAIVFRTTRAYDIAKAIGVDSTLPVDLVQATWDIVEPHADEWRSMGVFGPAVDVPDNAPLQDRLLGLTGRQP